MQCSGGLTSISVDQVPVLDGNTNGTEAVPGSGQKSVDHAVDPNGDLTCCFLRLANLPNFALTASVDMRQLFGTKPAESWYALDALHRRKSQERGRRFQIGTAALRAG